MKTLKHSTTVGSFDRRTFLQGLMGGTGLAVISPASLRASSQVPSYAEVPSVLVDLTRCIGCRACMRACKDSNGLPNNTELSEGFPDSWVREELRFDQWTVVNPETGIDYDGHEVTRNVKRQCMQCLEPTCVSVCPVGALTKSELGPILYDAYRCIGCRYCIMACPFDIPKFEWTSGLSPVIGKCNLCTQNRLAEGLIPACVEACPTGALKFGQRSTLLFEAQSRIKSRPDRYIVHVYGEKEAGGTAWLYMSDTPFENLGFKTDLEVAPMPNLTWDVLSKIPIVAAVMAGLFGTLSLSLTRGEKEKSE